MEENGYQICRWCGRGSYIKHLTLNLRWVEVDSRRQHLIAADAPASGLRRALDLSVKE